PMNIAQSSSDSAIVAAVASAASKDRYSVVAENSRPLGRSGFEAAVVLSLDVVMAALPVRLLWEVPTRQLDWEVTRIDRRPGWRAAGRCTPLPGPPVSLFPRGDGSVHPYRVRRPCL